MKKNIAKVALLSLTLGLSSCDVLEEVAQTAIDVSESGATTKLTNEQVISGLKEALTVGISNSVSLTSVTDGFLGNAEIKLPWPESALAMKEKALDLGLDAQVNKIVETLNRAAEDASAEAKPIFVNAIKNMSIADGFAILKGGEGAATNFLRENTTDQLVEAFSPKVQNSIEEVKLTQYWEPVATKYNKIMSFTGGEQITTDLNDYVTRKAIDGLFLMVEKEENNIRQDPAARVTDILKKVFGSPEAQN